MDPFDLNVCLSDLAPSVNRSIYFMGSGDLDISEWRGGRWGGANPGIRHLSDLPVGLIPDLLRPRILNHQQISWRSATPTDGAIDLSIPTRTSGLRELLATAVLINPVLRRMRGNISHVREISNSGMFTDYPPRDSLRIAVHFHGLISGPIDGYALTGALCLLLFGPYSGPDVDRGGGDSDSPPAVRAEGRSHFRDSVAISDLYRFRTPIESLSHFLAHVRSAFYGR